MALPGAVAADKPLRLGSTMLDTAGEEGYYTLKLDFQPESLQQAQQADLLLFGEGKVKLVPLLPESGDPGPCHFDGSLEQLQQRPAGDVECVAYFDGTEWTLQLVQAHLRAKHRPGAPSIPGYNVDLPEDVYEPSSNPAAEQEVDLAAVQQQMGAASIQQQGHNHNTAAAAAAAVHMEHEIDPDLDDALEEALFAADRPNSHAQHSQPVQDTPPAAHAAPAPTAQPAAAGRSPVQPHPQQQQQQQQQHQPARHGSHQQEQQQQQPQTQPQLPRQPPALQQPQQPQPQPQQQQQVHAAGPDAEEEEEEDSADESDDPWDTFDASAAPAPAPTAPKPAAPLAVHQQPHRHLTPVFAGGSTLAQPNNRQHAPAPAATAAAAPTAVQPAGAAAAAGATAAAARASESRGPVSVLGGDDEEEEEEEAGPGVQECSEDESDGVGVEYF